MGPLCTPISTISLRSFKARKDEILEEYTQHFNRVFRTTNPQKENSFQNELISQMDKQHLFSVDYIPSRGKRQGQPTTLFYLNKELFAWLSDTASLIDGRIVKEAKLTDVWAHADIPKADLANEGGVDFKRGKKPENLLKRLLEISTQRGELVLDSFAGSGTTGAVAHKMGRRWIMVELGDHCHTHVMPRLSSVIDSKDQSGVTKAINWKGGGGYRYYTLGSSLLEKDQFGNWIINKKFNPEMLAEAMCKLEGFTYSPNDEFYWQHGHSTETDFIYVTTQTLTREQLLKLNDEVGTNRSLLVCCGAFRVRKLDDFPRLTLKKIPLAVMAKCEWGKDDYSLEIKALPYTPEPVPDEFEEVVGDLPKNKRKARKVLAQQPSLFAMEGAE